MTKETALNGRGRRRFSENLIVKTEACRPSVPPLWRAFAARASSAQSELHRRALEARLPSSVAATNAAGLDGCRAGAQIGQLKPEDKALLDYTADA
jgi:hypothetical protein